MMQNLIELQREIDESTIIAGDFIIPLSEMERSNRQKMNKHIVKLNSTINQQQDTHSSQAHMEHSPR